MRFKLTENINDSIWYHISDKDFNFFKLNSEGMHLASSIDGAKCVMTNRTKDKGILYTVKIVEPLKPLYIDLDTMRWTAPNIAKLFIAKINNESIEGASGKDEWNEADKVMNNYKTNLSPDLIHINNLSKEDLPKLQEIAKDPADLVGIIKIGNFIESKGYNAINYELAEDNTQATRALLLWNPKMVQIIKKEPISI